MATRHFDSPTARTNMLTIRQEQLKQVSVTDLRLRLMGPNLDAVIAREFTTEWTGL